MPDADLSSSRHTVNRAWESRLASQVPTENFRPSRPPRLWPLTVGAAVFCAIALLAFVFSAAWVHDREQEFRAASVERALKTAGEHATQLIGRMDAAMLAALSAMEGEGLAAQTDADLELIARNALAGAPLAMSLQFWDSDGRGRGDFQDISIADRDYFRYHRPENLALPERATMINVESGMFVGTPVRSRITGAWSLPVSRGVADGSGRFSGIISVAYPIDTFLDVYTGMRDFESDLFALWRNDRTMLIRAPFTEELQGRRFENAAIWQHYPASITGRYEAPTLTDGRSRVVLFRGLDPLPLVLVYAIERQALAAGAVASYWPLLAVTFGAVAVAVAYAWLSLRYALRLSRSYEALRVAQAQTRLAAEARGRFIATMNHEFRTPLNAIIGFAEILDSRLFGELGSPKYAEYAKDIGDSGRHLLNLIDDVIDFSAIDLGKRELAKDVIDPEDGVRAAIRLVMPQSGRRGIRIEIEGRFPSVRGDARAIRQIAMNLLSNAVKFSPDGSTIKIRAVHDANAFAGFEVVDRGPGIPAAEIGRIGEPFFRGHRAEREAIGGTGLGIGISMALARQMGGHIGLHCPPEGGTCAALFLPAAGPA